MLNIGAHLSASKGFYAMGVQAKAIGANTFAYFTRNPRGGAAKAIKPDDVAKFLAFAAENHFAPLVAHAPYTLNAAAADEHILEFAVSAMSDDLVRMEYTPNNYYNFHPGSHVGQGAALGIDKIVSVLDSAMERCVTTTVLLETMAGKGSEIGSRFEELAEIISRCKYSDHLGVCFDTCHVYDAGYDIIHDLSGVLDEFDRVVGIARLRAVHINDTKNPFASHKDRHEKIGQGNLGIEALSRVINEPRLKNLPFILETPNEIDGYAEEIALLRSLSE